MAHDGVMICFYPTPEMALALHTALGGYTDLVAPTEMHMTLVYLGDIPELEAQGITKEKVFSVLDSLKGVLPPVKGVISGTGRFLNTHLEDKDAVVLLVDSPQLPDFRTILTNELTAQGIPYAQNHGFTPHITLLYVHKGEVAHYLPPVAEIAFNKVTLAWGDERLEVELTQPDPITVEPEETQPAVEALVEEEPESMLEKGLKRIRQILTPAPKEEFAIGFKALGGGWWLATFTNNFEDRHKEILAEDGHDRYVARLDSKLIPMPKLRHWHIAGSEHGQAQWAARAGHMVFAVGRFDDTAMGRAAEKHYQRNPGKYNISHKFLYPVWAEKQGVIYDYNAYEISTLPVGTEANPFTGFISIEEDKLMPLSEEKKKSLRSLFGSEEVFEQAMKQIEAMEAQGDKLAELGVKFKEYADLTTPANVTPAPQAQSELLLTVLEGQKSLVDGFDVVEKALEGIKAHFDAKVAELEKAKTAFEAKTKELDLFLSEKPRRVEDAQVVTDEKAKETIAQQSAGTEFDPRYPGMKVPLAQ